MIRDWYSGGRVDGVYPLPCYRAAIKALPADVLAYSEADADIERALAFARRGRDSDGAATAADEPVADGRRRDGERDGRGRRPGWRRARQRPPPRRRRRTQGPRPSRGDAGALRERAADGRRLERRALPRDRARGARRDAARDGRRRLGRRAPPLTAPASRPVDSGGGGTGDFPAKSGFFVPSDPRPSIPDPLTGRAHRAPGAGSNSTLGPGGQHGHRQAGDAGTAGRGVREQRPRRGSERRAAAVLHDPGPRPLRRDRVGDARRADPGQERSRVRAARRRVPQVLVADRDEHRRPEVLPRPHGLARARAQRQADDRRASPTRSRAGASRAATSPPTRRPRRSRRS